MYEVKVYKVVREPLTSRYVMMLDAVDNMENSVLIPICKNDAENISSIQCHGDHCKKSAFDMLSPILDCLPDVVLERLVIEDCDCGRFKADLFMTVDGDEKTIDCRPSDGVALAMERNFPIFVKRVQNCCVEEN